MTAAIDVSGAMEILLQKPKARKFSKILQEAELVTAPDLYVAELTNTLWKYHAAQELNKDECLRSIQDGINFVDKFIDSREVWSEAFVEGVNNRHSIYDMLYMITARRTSGILITNDAVLAAICKKNHVQICQ